MKQFSIEFNTIYSLWKNDFYIKSHPPPPSPQTHTKQLCTTKLQCFCLIYTIIKNPVTLIKKIIKKEKRKKNPTIQIKKTGKKLTKENKSQNLRERPVDVVSRRRESSGSPLQLIKIIHVVILIIKYYTNQITNLILLWKIKLAMYPNPIITKII